MSRPPPATIQVGSRVTCINTSEMTRLYNETMPIAGLNYIVREIIEDPDTPGSKCYRLDEIHNLEKPYASGVKECAFKAARFKLKKGR